MKKERMYDVVAVNLETNKVRIMYRDKTLRNADAIVTMAVARRGVDEEFFSETVAGMYSDGDTWRGDGDN